MIISNHVTWIDSFPVPHYQISRVMLLRFGKGLLKAENVIEGMDRAPLSFVAKIKSFISIWLLGLFFLSGITFLQMSHRMMSLSSKRLIQKWRHAMLGHLLWDQKLLQDQFQNGSRKIICLFTRSFVSMLLKYCLNFLETWRYIIILIPIISILDCLSTQ